MRWLPMMMLAGCVPISADEYVRGELDSGELDSSVPGAEIREDARAMDAKTWVDTSVVSADAASAPDAVQAPARHDASTSIPDDAALAPDASPALDAAVADAAKDAGVVPAVIDCTTPGVLCEDFQFGPKCPSDPRPNWSECEQIGNLNGPQQEGLANGDDAGTSAGYALRSRIVEVGIERSQRVLRVVPVDADYFEASFWMITDPTDNAWFVWTKFQQEVGQDADGDPLNYPGVSLIGQSGRMVLTVETQQSLSPADDASYYESDLGPWPANWHHYKLQIDFAKRNVHVEYYDESYGDPVVADLPAFATTKVPVRRQYFALGLYADNPGAVQMLFDDVFAYAKKDGKLIPLP